MTKRSTFLRYVLLALAGVFGTWLTWSDATAEQISVHLPDDVFILTSERTVPAWVASDTLFARTTPNALQEALATMKTLATQF